MTWLLSTLSVIGAVCGIISIIAAVYWIRSAAVPYPYRKGTPLPDGTIPPLVGTVSATKYALGVEGLQKSSALNRRSAAWGTLSAVLLAIAAILGVVVTLRG
jgi:hypothetical protein